MDNNCIQTKNWILKKKSSGGGLTRHQFLKKHQRFEERVTRGPERCCEFLHRRGKIEINEMECLYISFILEILVSSFPENDFKEIYIKFCTEKDSILDKLNKSEDCREKIKAVMECLCKGRGKRLGERLSITESDNTSFLASAVGSTMGALATIGILTINVPAGLISAAAYGTYLENVKNRYRALKLTKRQRTIRFSLIYLQLAYKYQEFLDSDVDDFDKDACVSFKGLKNYQDAQRQKDPFFSITRKLLEKARTLADQVVRIINNERNVVYKDAMRLRDKLDDLLILIKDSKIHKSQLYAVGVFL